MKAYRCSKGVSPLVLKLCVGWCWLYHAPAALSPGKNVGTHWARGSVDPRIGHYNMEPHWTRGCVGTRIGHYNMEPHWTRGCVGPRIAHYNMEPHWTRGCVGPRIGQYDMEKNLLSQTGFEFVVSSPQQSRYPGPFMYSITFFFCHV